MRTHIGKPSRPSPDKLEKLSRILRNDPISQKRLLDQILETAQLSEEDRKRLGDKVVRITQEITELLMGNLSK